MKIDLFNKQRLNDMQDKIDLMYDEISELHYQVEYLTKKLNEKKTK